MKSKQKQAGLNDQSAELLALRKALSASEERFRKLFEDTPQAALIIGDNCFIDCNRAALAMLHLREAAQIQGVSPSAISPEYQPDGQRSDDKARELFSLAHERGSQVFEWEYIRADGEHFLAEVSLTPISDAGQKLLYVVWRDITGRKQAESALKTASQYARSLIEASPDPLATISAEGKIMDVNRATEVVTGLSREHLIGSDFSSYFTDPDKAQASYRQAFEKGEVVAYPLSIRHISGSVTEVLYNATLYYDTEGNMAGVFASARDITTIRRVEHKLAESESRLRAIIESEPECIKIVNAAGLLVEMNPAGLAMIEADSLQQASGQRVLDLVTPEFRAAFSEMHQRVIAGEAIVMEFEICGLKGGHRWVETHAVPMREANGEIVHLAVTRDITERKRLEQTQEKLRSQLQQAQKMETIGQLTGGIAHDFNNILAAILGYTGLALERFVPDKDSKLANYLREVQTAGERARDLIAKMLAFSRGAKGASIALDAAPLVKEIGKTLRSIIPSSIELDTKIEDGLPAILGDPVQLHQALMNLAINARDAIGEHGYIHIVLGRPGLVRASCDSCHHDIAGDYVELAVIDSGSGIQPEILNRIFDPFFTTKEVGKGTGMGLSMVHGVMHEHGGHIRVHSLPGQGTTIRLLFPVALQSTPPIATKGERKGETPQAISARIMVVDDETAVSRMLKEILEMHGHRVTAYNNSRAALMAFQADPFAWDIIITDHTMPGLSGTELARQILERYPELPIFLCTGYSEVVDEAFATQLGIRRFFQKPVDTQMLLKVIQDMIEQEKNSTMVCAANKP